MTEYFEYFGHFEKILDSKLLKNNPADHKHYNCIMVT